MIEAFMALVAAVLLAAAFYFWWSRKTGAEIAADASAEWARLSASDPELVAGLDEARFQAAFRRAHFPRFPKYALAIAAAFVAALPLTLGLLAMIAWGLDSIGLSADAQNLARSIPIEGSIAGVSRWAGSASKATSALCFHMSQPHSSPTGPGTPLMSWRNASRALGPASWGPSMWAAHLVSVFMMPS